MKRVAILGSTGSIGESTLSVVRAFPERFRVVALAAGSRVDALERQAREWKPRVVAMGDRRAAAELRRRLGSSTPVLEGPEGLSEVAAASGVDIVVSALVGAAGLRPTYAALEAGRAVALANKEALVVAGEWMTACAARSKGCLLPVDSEHNALHQCLRGERLDEVRRMWLTASGGPFRTWPRARLEQVTRDEALAHPTWKMGAKITIDSATMMNKGLEVIEARWLFGLGSERIRVVVHPQSVVHSMVEFADGSFKAQLGVTDMRLPIQYALTWPDRVESPLPAFDPVAAGPLEFAEPDLERFPCLGLARSALEAGGGAPAVLNAANEVAVEAFLAERIRFTEIPRLIDAALDRYTGEAVAGLDDLLAIDGQVRDSVRHRVDGGVRS